MLADPPERPLRVGRPAAVVPVERGAVVDEPQPPVPPEQVRVVRRAVDVRQERVEPDDRRGKVGIRRRAACRRERQRAGKEVDAEVGALAREEQVLDLAIGLGAADRDVELDDHDLGRRQLEPPCERARDHLRDERLRPLSGAPELDDVQPVVVRLHEPRERPAFAKRLDVPGRGDGAHARSLRGAGHCPNSGVAVSRGRRRRVGMPSRAATGSRAASPPRALRERASFRPGASLRRGPPARPLLAGYRGGPACRQLRRRYGKIGLVSAVLFSDRAPTTLAG